jgi:hypothetical protein
LTEVLDISLITGNKVIDGYDLVPLGNEPISKMASNEAGTTCQYDTHFDPL